MKFKFVFLLLIFSSVSFADKSNFDPVDFMQQNFGLTKDFNASTIPESKMYICKRKKRTDETNRDYANAKVEWKVYTFPDKIQIVKLDEIIPDAYRMKYSFTTIKKHDTDAVDVYGAAFLSDRDEVSFIIRRKNNYDFYYYDGRNQADILWGKCEEPSGLEFLR